MTKTLRSLHLDFWECRALRDRQDVTTLVVDLARAGLRPGVGPWTVFGGHPAPVDLEALPELVETHERPTPAYQRQLAGGTVGVSSALVMWRFGVVRTEQPQIFSNLTISQRPGDRWDVGMFVMPDRHTYANVSLDGFLESWIPFLQDLGDSLFERLSPALGALTNSDDALVRMPTAVAERRLIVGCRTWFGPAYVQAFGEDFLLGLPDRAERAPAQSVRHALSASPRQLVEGDRSIYNGVRDYLKQADVAAAFPPVKGSASAPSPAEGNAAVEGSNRVDQELTEFRREFAELLSITTLLADGQQLKFLDIEWSQLSDPAKQALLFQSIRDATEKQQRRRPNAPIRFEFGPGAPDALRRFMDEFTNRRSGVHYVILPVTN